MKKNFLLLLTFLIWVSFSAFAKEDTQVFFSPSLKCENNIVEQINNSTSSIDAAVYAINNEEIVKALKQAYDRGVKIRILTDKLQAANKSSKVTDLYRYGINIRVNSKFRIEHNKFAIFDNKVVSSGSYNWTNPASHKNSENCIFFIDETKVLTEYSERFDYLWRINTKKKSEEFFKKQHDKFNLLWR